MELDIFIPDLNLAFEYQGEQHFMNIFAVLEHKIVLNRDNEKKKACNEVKMNLLSLVYPSPLFVFTFDSFNLDWNHID
jgi:hypothetical protein